MAFNLAEVNADPGGEPLQGVFLDIMQVDESAIAAAGCDGLSVQLQSHRAASEYKSRYQVKLARLLSCVVHCKAIPYSWGLTLSLSNHWSFGQTPVIMMSQLLHHVNLSCPGPPLAASRFSRDNACWILPASGDCLPEYWRKIAPNGLVNPPSHPHFPSGSPG